MFTLFKTLSYNLTLISSLFADGIQVKVASATSIVLAPAPPVGVKVDVYTVLLTAVKLLSVPPLTVTS